MHIALGVPLICLMLFAGVLIFFLAPYTDIAISAKFFNGTAFYQNKMFSIFTSEVTVAIVGLAAAIFILWLAGCIRHKKWICGINTQIMLFTTGSMFIGPGLIVNGIFKTFWGRARPLDIEPFNGEKQFSSPWQISDQCNLDCSFMSGHTATAFWLLSLALLLPKKYKTTGIILACVFGCFMGIIRIMQGKHFVSDVLSSAIIMVAIVLLMYELLIKKQKLF